MDYVTFLRYSDRLKIKYIKYIILYIDLFLTKARLL